MPELSLLDNPEFKTAYLANERQERINTGKVASLLVVFLMPVGVLLDYFVYPDEVLPFLTLRLLCAGRAVLLWHLHRTEAGQAHYRLLGPPIALLPAFFICWMVFLKEGPASPYYAGLNLILLAVSVVVHWNRLESMIAIGGVMLMYLSACLLRGSKEHLSVIFNNLYFITLTGIIVITGNYLFNRLRFREFALRFELDRNRLQLEESHRKLVELDEAKSRFFANISHELRTPLTLLIAPLENLLNRFRHAFDEETRNLLMTMQSNGMRLLKLINDLLDLVRLESGQLHVKREPMEVADFIKGLASAVRQVAADKRINLDTKIDPELSWVLADRDKLEKIILNLVFNALKFTPAGGRVSLWAEKQGANYVLTVQDTGMGISAQNLKNVFSRFWQADDSSRRKYQGVGIGLALVKELTEVQGGKASVSSEEGKGTTFRVELPYEKAETGERAVEQQAPAGPASAVTQPAMGTAAGSNEWLSSLYRRAELFPAMTPVQETIRKTDNVRGNLPKLVVADDEPDMLRFMKSQLQSHYEVIEAVDGQQAIEKASQFLPDIIVLDMMMPEKDGLQACRELRQRSTTQSIPVILVTARADEETKLAALDAGASDFLPKPFSTTELHVRIKNLVDSYHYQRKLSKQNHLLEHTIEQLKDTESQLVQSEKLASLGRMSAGIIHEINNPLNFATTGLYTLRNKGRYLAPEHQAEYAEILKDVEEGLVRVKTIVSDLRSFSHNETAMVEEVDVTEVVTSTLRFLSHETKDRVRIEQRMTEGQVISANKNKLIQVAVNLLQNSIDALKEKTFSDDEQPTIWIEGKIDDNRSLLMIRDNGNGIEGQNLDKIFDPFFTTKDVGKGMGLGLSICYRIVQEYEGRIGVRSERGKFCEFTLEFPLKGEAMAA